MHLNLTAVNLIGICLNELRFLSAKVEKNTKLRIKYLEYLAHYLACLLVL